MGTVGRRIMKRYKALFEKKSLVSFITDTVMALNAGNKGVPLELRSYNNNEIIISIVSNDARIISGVQAGIDTLATILHKKYGNEIDKTYWKDGYKMEFMVKMK